MKKDNKCIGFPARNEGFAECIFNFDQAIRKDIAWGGMTDYPRNDEDDGNVLARDNQDHDYSAKRDDDESWMERRNSNGDQENQIREENEDYYLLVNREPEQPEMFGEWVLDDSGMDFIDET